MINSSFINIPQIHDQDVYTIRNPLPLSDSFKFEEGFKDREDLVRESQTYKYFPTSAMYNRQSNFQRMDLESLFFAFYYQTQSYQQYLAAIELKKRSW